jgi:neutral ceramidase
MEIGFGRTDITPPLGVLMGGQLHEVRAASVESRLFAKAVCLRSGDACFVVVSCDILILSVDDARAIRRLVEDSTGIPAANVLVATTHTHSGPITGRIFGMASENGYLERLPGLVCDAVRAAKDSLRTGTVHVASTTPPQVAWNRRYVMRDGTVQTHPQKGDPAMESPEGPEERELGVVHAIDADGRSMGGIVCFACHATAMPRDSTAISADFPGHCTRALEERMGSGTTVLFLQGPSGNICQVDPRNLAAREVGAAYARTMGEALAAAAWVAIRRPGRVVAGRRAADRAVESIRATHATILIPRRKPEPAVLRWALGTVARPCTDPLPGLGDYGVEEHGKLPAGKLSLADLFATRAWLTMEAREILAAAEQAEKAPQVETELTVLAIGDFALACVPCELFAEYGLEIRRRSPFSTTFVAELVNGWVGYMPTQKAFSRAGGYETKFISTSSLSENAGERLTARVADMLRELRG